MRSFLFFLLTFGEIFTLSFCASHANADWEFASKNEQWKNERVIEVLSTARNAGIEEWKEPVLLGWLAKESRNIDYQVRGDRGKSVGICQCHTSFRKCETEKQKQREQCIGWFKSYTANSTALSIYSDIRKGHNSRGGSKYENGIKNLQSVFVFYENTSPDIAGRDDELVSMVFDSSLWFPDHVEIDHSWITGSSEKNFCPL